MDCSMPGLPVHHQYPEFTQTLLSRWCHPAISPSVVPFSSHLKSFPASGSFPRSQFFASGGQSIGVSASASVLPMNIQDWFPLGWTGWNIAWNVPLVSLIFLKRSLVFPKYWSFSISPYNIQGWFPLGLTGWVSLQSTELSSLLRHHSWKHWFFAAQPSLWSGLLRYDYTQEEFSSFIHVGFGEFWHAHIVV